MKHVKLVGVKKNGKAISFATGEEMTGTRTPIREHHLCRSDNEDEEN